MLSGPSCEFFTSCHLLPQAQVLCHELEQGTRQVLNEVSVWVSFDFVTSLNHFGAKVCASSSKRKGGRRKRWWDCFIRGSAGLCSLKASVKL